MSNEFLETQDIACIPHTLDVPDMMSYSEVAKCSARKIRSFS